MRYFFQQFINLLDPQTTSYLLNRLVVILWITVCFGVLIYFDRLVIKIASGTVAIFLIKKLLTEVREKHPRRYKIQNIVIAGYSHDIRFEPMSESNKMFIVILVSNHYEYTDLFNMEAVTEKDGKYTWGKKKVGKSAEQKGKRKVRAFEELPVSRFQMLLLQRILLSEKRQTVFNVNYLKWQLERIRMPFFKRVFLLPSLPPNSSPTLLGEGELSENP